MGGFEIFFKMFSLSKIDKALHFSPVLLLGLGIMKSLIHSPTRLNKTKPFDTFILYRNESTKLLQGGYRI